MPTISKKGQQMPESPIRKLVPYAEAAKKKGRKVYHLNIGQPDIATPEKAMDAVKKSDIRVLAYSRSEGSETYRKKIADYYQKHRISVDHEDIVVTTGGSEALLFAIGSISDPGDELIIPEPFYANYNGFATASGVRIVSVASSLANGFALPPIASFEALISSKTKAILICNPGNPTGCLYTKEEINKLGEIAIKYDLFLIVDEVYREFTYDGLQHYSVLQEEGLEQHAIMIDSVSKRYSMCGARIGCLVSKNKQLLYTVLKFAQARLSPPTLAQIASEAALDTPESYFEEITREYKKRRDVLIEGLNGIKGVTAPIPGGAFYCIAELPVADADDFCQWLLESFHYDNETVMLAPAAGFYTTPGMGANQVRIAYVLHTEALKKAVKIIEKALEQYPGNTVTSIGNFGRP